MTAMPSLKDRRPAVVTIDMHRGHLDPETATMPLPTEVADRVTRANANFLREVRLCQVPVIHVVTGYRSVQEIASNPWWSAVAGTTASRANVLKHQLPGSPGLELMPDVYDPEYDLVVTGKKRYDCFAATDLEHALRALGTDTLLLTGVNTNSCVLATTVAGNTKDFAVVVVEDCVDTMDPALHEAALAVVRQAFGWVAKTDQVVAAL
jgi:nicotinamidase-related amidase